VQSVVLCLASGDVSTRSKSLSLLDRVASLDGENGAQAVVVDALDG
jgi:hypothetical protein